MIMQAKHRLIDLAQAIIIYLIIIVRLSFRIGISAAGEPHKLNEQMVNDLTGSR